uniref:BEACH domain-containing protein n=1 Tax=Rodentolepis nana TaxID=102285 RepID=A0A0R3T9B7_RODNA
LTQTSTRTSSINSISQTDSNEQSTPNCRYANASRSPSSAWWPSRLGSPICATPEVNEDDQTRPPQIAHEQSPPIIYLTGNTKNNNNNLRYSREAPSFQMPFENDPMNILIKEVVDRLRRSPHLPLIVMPTQVPGTPPLVFQLPSADVVFVGLPACNSLHGHVRPRLVTSPVETSAFVVTSKRDVTTPISHLPSGDRVSGSRFTVAAPNPGSILGVSATGDLYEFKLANT